MMGKDLLEGISHRITWPWRWLLAHSRNCGISRADGLVIGLGEVLVGRNVLHGGAVKLLELEKFFEVNDRLFSILYLVSSALPEFAESLVSTCRRNKILFVWNQNGVAYPAWAGKKTSLINNLLQKLLSQADFVIYQSDFCRRSADKWLGSSIKDSRILLNPVDLEFFRPPQEQLSLKPLRLLTMGTHHHPGRVIPVIDALAKLRLDGWDARLTIAGRLLWPGGEHQTQRAIEQHNLKNAVQILPAFDRQGALKLCQTHHILIHPKPMDPCPTVVAEAMACGLAIVASNTGGLPEMVDDTCGQLIPGVDDWEELHFATGKELADAAGSLAQNWQEASRAARARAERLFSAKNWVAAHEQIFEELLAPS